MFSKLSSILPKTINRSGMRKTFDAAVVCAQYAKIAAQIVHPEALEHTHAHMFRDGILVIAVINPAWGQKVMENAPKLIQDINKHLGSNYIKSCKIKVTDKMRDEFF